METEMEKKISWEIRRLLGEQKKEQNDHDQHLSSICLVPDDIRCKPSFKTDISIGFSMESLSGPSRNVKMRYMFSLFECLKSPPDEIMNECMHKVQAKEDRIRACYNSDINIDYYCSSTAHFASCMVIDACYILGLIHKWSQYIKDEGSSFSDKLLLSLQTKCDLIVLDNQMPFFVLQDIFECTILKIDPTASLVELILSFLKEIIPFEANSITGHHGTGDTDYKHILDLVYKTYQPPDARSSYRLSTVTTTYSAVELAKAGVKFKPNQDNMAIKFESSWGNATLTMPAMRIDESTAPVLWNLTAYERCFPEVGNYIASYAFAMMMIVSTKEDLLQLGESKIVRYLNGHQYIMDLIHELCKGVALKHFPFAKEWQKMDNYCNSFLGYTRRTYFSGAWIYIASVSALILFILITIQT